MTKVVINRCFGGFGLSLEGERAYLKRKGKEAFFYKQEKFMHKDGVNSWVRIDDPKERSLFTTTSLKDMGPNVDNLWELKLDFFYDGDIDRDDPDLVAVVEELGEDADGYCAELKVVEVPDGVDWEIDEYDGMESVDEAHRSWS